MVIFQLVKSKTCEGSKPSELVSEVTSERALEDAAVLSSEFDLVSDGLGEQAAKVKVRSAIGIN